MRTYFPWVVSKEGAYDHFVGSHVSETDGQLTKSMTYNTYQAKKLWPDTCSSGGLWILNFHLQKVLSTVCCNRFMHGYGRMLHLEDICSYVPYNKIGYLIKLWTLERSSGFMCSCLTFACHKQWDDDIHIYFFALMVIGEYCLLHGIICFFCFP
jgi:hypothetical protein